MKYSSLPLLFLLTGSVLAQPAPAPKVPSSAASPLRLVLSQDLVTTVTGEGGRTAERLTPLPKAVQPGDTLTQNLSVSNTGKVDLRGAVLTLPVPQGTVYLGGATTGGERWDTLFSRDGGKSFGAAPLKKLVTVTENGRAVQKEVTVPPSEYTTVRWVVRTLTPDETLKFSFRVKVK